MWDFSLVNIAAAFKLNGDAIEDSRIVAGAVQTTPRRLTNVENAIQGRTKNLATGESVKQIASEGARALAHNGFKIPLLQNLVKRAISAWLFLAKLIEEKGIPSDRYPFFVDLYLSIQWSSAIVEAFRRPLD